VKSFALAVMGWNVVEELVAALALYGTATFLGDFVHHGLHLASRSRWRLLARVGALHDVHHKFLGADLRIHPEHTRQNLIYHRIPEYFTQVLATLLGLWLVPARLVALVIAFETVLAVVGTVRGGLDSNHTETPHARWSYLGLFVGPLYHAMHHLYPEACIGSTTRLFDFVFATGCPIAGRRFAMTGASGALGRPLARRIKALGGHVVPLKYGRDYSYDDYHRLDAQLASVDVLVLCHGSKVRDAMDANCSSFVAIIERFRRLHADKRPIEVWAVGSEIEAHPAWGDPDLGIYLRSKRAYARHARRYFHDGRMLYRHIVPSAYTSPMGKGLISGDAAAAIAMFFILRGFRYVPVSYTGIALLNWVSYLWPPEDPRLGGHGELLGGADPS
jgi:hypothetical protein